MSESKTIAMFTKVGEQEVSVGSCHPAQARVLVSDEFAMRQEGRLQIIMRPIWMDIASTHGFTKHNEVLSDSGRPLQEKLEGLIRSMDSMKLIYTMGTPSGKPFSSLSKLT